MLARAHFQHPCRETLCIRGNEEKVRQDSAETRFHDSNNNDPSNAFDKIFNFFDVAYLSKVH